MAVLPPFQRFLEDHRDDVWRFLVAAVGRDDRPPVEKFGEGRDVLLRRLTSEGAAQRQILPVPRLEQERHRAHAHRATGRLVGVGPVHLEGLAAAGVRHVEAQDESALVPDEPLRCNSSIPSALTDSGSSAAPSSSRLERTT